METKKSKLNLKVVSQIKKYRITFILSVVAFSLSVTSGIAWIKIAGGILFGLNAIMAIIGIILAIANEVLGKAIKEAEKLEAQ